MADRADFAAAVRALAAEERALAGGHPDTEEVAAYAAGSLPAAQAEELRAHLAVCPECSDLVLEYAEFQPQPASSAASKAEVAAAYRDLRRDLGFPAEVPADPSYQAAAARPVAPWLLAAAALVVCVLGLWVWRQHLALETARTAPRINVAAVDLVPEGSDRVRGTEPSDGSLDLAAGATLFLALPGMSADAELRVSIVDAAGRELWALPGARLDPVLSNVSLHLQPGSLPPGPYEIRVSPPGGGEPVLASYRIRVR